MRWKTYVIGVVVFILLATSTFALTKGVEGWVVDEEKAISNARIIIYVDAYKENEGFIHCYSHPLALTNKKGYFINNLANLRRIDSGKNCEDYWEKGHNITVTANGYVLTGDAPFKIPEESGRTFQLGKLYLTDVYFEPINLSIKDVEIAAHNYFIDWRHKLVDLNIVVENRMDSPAQNIKMRVSILDDSRKEVISIDEGWFHLAAEEARNIPLVADFANLPEGQYTYNIILYDAINVLDIERNNPLDYTRPIYAEEEKPSTMGPYLDIWLALVLIIVLLFILNILILIEQKKEKESEKK